MVVVVGGPCPGGCAVGGRVDWLFYAGREVMVCWAVLPLTISCLCLAEGWWISAWVVSCCRSLPGAAVRKIEDCGAFSGGPLGCLHWRLRWVFGGSAAALRVRMSGAGVTSGECTPGGTVSVAVVGVLVTEGASGLVGAGTGVISVSSSSFFPGSCRVANLLAATMNEYDRPSWSVCGLDRMMVAGGEVNCGLCRGSRLGEASLLTFD